MKKWKETTARDALIRNGHKVGDKAIRINRPGIKMWGAIDFLVRSCGYRVA